MNGQFVRPIELVQHALGTVGDPFAAREAIALLLAIGYQESRFATRRQQSGPARGFWQFEVNAVREFVDHGEDRLRKAASASGVMLETSVMYSDFGYQEGDIAACLAARDLLWRDPAPLPQLYDGPTAWHYYTRNWRPGRPDMHRWHVYSYPHAIDDLPPLPPS